MSYLTQAEYDAKVSAGEIDEDTYYYTTIEESYVTESKFNEKIAKVNDSIGAANKAVTDMQAQITALLETIDTLKSRLDVLEGNTEEPSE